MVWSDPCAAETTTDPCDGQRHVPDQVEFVGASLASLGHHFPSSNWCPSLTRAQTMASAASCCYRATTVLRQGQQRAKYWSDASGRGWLGLASSCRPSSGKAVTGAWSRLSCGS